MGKINKCNKKNDSSKGKNPKQKIDHRFDVMFTDEDFNLKYVTDKKGRRINHTSSQDLKDFYSIPTSESDSENEDEQASDAQLKTGQVQKKSRKNKNQHKLKTSQETVKNVKAEGVEPGDDNSNETSSDSGDDNSNESSSDSGDDIEDDLDDDEFDHKWEELDANVPVASEVTKRLALCNMDWDRIRAEDILTVFNSFKPANGIIHSVKIFPSEYGVQRMEEEKLNGPAELVERTLASNEDNMKENKEGSKYHREKLRQYQLNRLKYYYAVIECDSPETADSLYEQLNGMEYESSAVSMDLRFIPDDTSFDEEPTWSASSAPNPTEYKPRLFANSALQQVKVNLTWDETDPKRRETIKKAFTDPDSVENDIKNYLASSSGSEDEEESASNENREMKLKDRLSMYKGLLQSIEEKEKQKKNKWEMEITWDPDLKEKTEEKVKEKIEKETFTPFEEKLKKKKEETKQKKKERKMLLKKGVVESSGSELEDEIDQSTDEERLNDFDLKNAKVQESASEDDDQMVGQLSLLVSESNEETLARTQHGSKKEQRKQKMKEKRKQKIKEKQEKKKAKEAKTYNIYEDERFSKLYTSDKYNIDPSAAQFKVSNSIQKLVQEQVKKRKMDEDTEYSSNPLSKNRFAEGISNKKSKKSHSRSHQKNSHDDSDIEGSINIF